jgi:hypothetical protein
MAGVNPHAMAAMTGVDTEAMAGASQPLPGHGSKPQPGHGSNCHSFAPHVSTCKGTLCTACHTSACDVITRQHVTSSHGSM